MKALSRLRPDFKKDYVCPEAVDNDNYLSGYPKYSTECAGNNAGVKRLVQKIKRAVEKGKATLPDFFVGVGNSGMGLASVLSYEFNIPMIYIRKGSISRFAGAEATQDREGHPNKYPGGDVPYALQEKAKEMGCHPSVYFGKTFWFVDDCIDSGTTFRQAVHICTHLYGMVLSGVGLTDFARRTAQQIKEWGLLKNSVRLPIYKRVYR